MKIKYLKEYLIGIASVIGTVSYILSIALLYKLHPVWALMLILWPAFSLITLAVYTKITSDN